MLKKKPTKVVTVYFDSLQTYRATLILKFRNSMARHDSEKHSQQLRSLQEVHKEAAPKNPETHP